MKRRLALKSFVLAGLAVTAVAFLGNARAGEPLPSDSVLAYARNNRAPKPPAPPKISPVTLNGTIRAATPNGLKINASKTSKTTNQKPWFVASKTDTEVTIHGTATLDYVRKGQTIEFTAQLVNNEKLSEKLKEFTIVARKGGKAKKNDIAKNDAKDHPAGAAGAGADAAKADADSEPSLGVPEDSKPAANAAVAGGKPEVVGPKTKILAKIATVDAKSLTVTAGERTIHIDLVEIPTINVEISDPVVIPDTKDSTKIRIEGPGPSGHLVSLMAEDLVGAKIIVHGTGAETKIASLCEAKDMDITLSKPLTGKKPLAAQPSKSVADAK
jgi:hypothetical protein